MRHQLSYTVGRGIRADPETNFGDVYLNYRYQALEEGPGRPAFSPRLSLILTARGRAGSQFNLPVSKQSSDFYFHWNGGFTWLPRGDEHGPVVAVSRGQRDLPRAPDVQPDAGVRPDLRTPKKCRRP